MHRSPQLPKPPLLMALILDYPVLPWFLPPLVPEKTIWWYAAIFMVWLIFLISKQHRQSTEGNTNHWPQSTAWLHPFFVHHCIPEGRSIAHFMLALQRQYLVLLNCKYRVENWTQSQPKNKQIQRTKWETCVLRPPHFTSTANGTVVERLSATS